MSATQAGPAHAPRDEGLERLEAFIAALQESQANLQRSRATLERREEERADVSEGASDQMDEIGSEALALTDRTIRELYAHRREIVHAWMMSPLFPPYPTGSWILPLGQVWIYNPGLAKQLEDSYVVQIEMAFAVYEDLPRQSEEAEDAIEDASREAGAACDALAESVAEDLAQTRDREGDVAPPSMDDVGGAVQEGVSAGAVHVEQQADEWSRDLEAVARDVEGACEAFADGLEGSVSSFLDGHEDLTSGFLAGLEDLDRELAVLATALGIDAGGGLAHCGGRLDGSGGFALPGQGPLEFAANAHATAAEALRPIEGLMAPLTLAAGVVGTIRELLDAFTPF